MTPSGILNGNSKWNREYDGRNAGVSVARPLNLRDELNRAYTAQMMKARSVRGSRKPADVAVLKRAEASMSDLQEQLTLLDAIEAGYVKPNFSAALNFVADMTPEMDAEFERLIEVGAL